MLTVTESAKQKLRQTLITNTNDQEAGLRLTMEPPGQLGLVLDRESPNDSLIEHEGLKVLIVDHELAELLQEATIDVQDTHDGPKLTIF